MSTLRDLRRSSVEDSKTLLAADPNVGPPLVYLVHSTEYAI